MLLRHPECLLTGSLNHLCWRALAVSGPAIDGPIGSGRAFRSAASKGKQRVDEALDRFRHAVGHSRARLINPPFRGEMRFGGKLDIRGDVGCMQRCRCKVGMKRLRRVELGDRQRPDQIVEVARVALSDWLEILHTVKYDPSCSGWR